MTLTEIAMAKAKANKRRRSKNSKLSLKKKSIKNPRNNQRKKRPNRKTSPKRKKKPNRTTSPKRTKSPKNCKICGFDCNVGMFSMNACTCNNTNCKGYKLSKRQISLAKEFGDMAFSLKMDEMTSTQLARERAKLNRSSGNIALSEIVRFTDYGEQIIRGTPYRENISLSQLAMERARNNRKGSSRKMSASQLAMERARDNRRNT